MFFGGGDPFDHFGHGGSGGPRARGTNGNVDTTKLYETLGVSCKYLLITVFFFFELKSQYFVNKRWKNLRTKKKSRRHFVSLRE